MKAKFILALNLCLSFIGAILLGVLSVRAELPAVSVGLGVAALFLLAAAFRAFKAVRSKNLEQDHLKG